jgi:hypothetical protein
LFSDNGYSFNISDLDEKLLKLKDVVDFEASFYKKDEVTCLEIKIITLNHLPVESEVLNELSMIPGISESLRNGVLDIKIEFVRCGTEYLPKTGKRKLSLKQGG